MHSRATYKSTFATDRSSFNVRQDICLYKRKCGGHYWGCIQSFTQQGQNFCDIVFFLSKYRQFSTYRVFETLTKPCKQKTVLLENHVSRGLPVHPQSICTQLANQSAPTILV